ncbi:MAG: ribosomal protein S18-alanine N-acetyltransferase [Acidaminococcaceae bacterium]
MGKTATINAVRPRVAADLVAIQEIDRGSFHSAWSMEMWLSELNSPLSDYFVLEAEDRIIGYAGYWLVAGEAQVTRVAVSPDVRNQGLGKRIMQILLERVWAQDAEAVTLEVRQQNLAAQKVYTQCGFDEVGVRPNYYVETGENAVIMWLYSSKE